MSYSAATDPYRTPPPILSKADEDNLTLLSILFYVYSVITGLSAIMCAGFAILPAVLFESLASSMPRHPGDPPPWFFGTIFLIIFGAASMLLVVKTVIMIVAGRSMGKRSSYVLCMIAACFALLNIPLGTALGIFTIIMLQKPQVKARFGNAPS